MKNNMHLLRAMSDIRPEYIEESADAAPSGGIHRFWRAAAAVAAVACIGAAVLILIPRNDDSLITPANSAQNLENIVTEIHPSASDAEQNAESTTAASVIQVTEIAAEQTDLSEQSVSEPSSADAPQTTTEKCFTKPPVHGSTTQTVSSTTATTSQTTGSATSATTSGSATSATTTGSTTSATTTNTELPWVIPYTPVQVTVNETVREYGYNCDDPFYGGDAGEWTRISVSDGWNGTYKYEQTSLGNGQERLRLCAYLGSGSLKVALASQNGEIGSVIDGTLYLNLVEYQPEVMDCSMAYYTIDIIYQTGALPKLNGLNLTMRVLQDSVNAGSEVQQEYRDLTSKSIGDCIINLYE